MAAGRLTARLGAAFDAVPGSWRAVTEPFRLGETGRALTEFVDGRVAQGAAVYPPEPLRALSLTPLGSVRAVILGQDPYHGPGQAEGLAFSVPAGVKPPPSLRNIFKELQRDLGFGPSSGSLAVWAERGVLLLNTVLSVEEGAPACHAGKGWEQLSDCLIDAVAAQHSAVAFLLWGVQAQAKLGRIEAASNGRHRAWLANHPSPLSATRAPRPFMGCGHFGQSAAFLAARGEALDWSLV